MYSPADIVKCNIFDKLKIWNHYNITQLGLKYNFHILDTFPKPHPDHHWDKQRYEVSMKGWGVPDKVLGYLQLRYLWKNVKCLSFDEFTDEDLYQWYWRFEQEIDL